MNRPSIAALHRWTRSCPRTGGVLHALCHVIRARRTRQLVWSPRMKTTDDIPTRTGTRVRMLVVEPFAAVELDADNETVVHICLDGVGTFEERGATYLARAGFIAVRVAPWRGQLSAGLHALRVMRFAWPPSALARLGPMSVGISTHRTLYGRSSVELAWRAADELQRRAPYMPEALGVFSDGIALGICRFASHLGATEPARANRARKAIERRFKETLNLGGLAHELGCTPEHLSRVFKATYGFSPREFLLRYRIERAKVLLAKTDRTITAISLELGFHDGAHFARHFRTFAGMTPLAFRARQRAINSVGNSSES